MVYFGSTRQKIFSIITLSVFLGLIRIAALPHYYSLGVDEIFEAQFARTIVDTGVWDPTLGSGFSENYYGYTPVLHFMLAFVSLISGMKTYTLIKYVFPILYKFAIVFFTFIVIREITGKQKKSFLATLIFLSSAGYAFLGITRRTTASLFLLLALYALLKGRSNVWFVLYAAFSLLMILSNRSISMYFLFFLTLAWLYEKLMKPASFPRFGPYLLFFSISFFIWQFAFSSIFLAEDADYVVKIKEIIYNVVSFGEHNTVDIYHPLEKFLIYGAQLCFLILALYGLLLYYKKLKKEKVFTHDSFLFFFSIMGIIFFIFSALLIGSELDTAITITLWFFSIPLCVLVCYTLEQTRSSVRPFCAAFVILLLFLSSMLMGMYTPRLTNRSPNEDIVIGTDDRAKSEQLFQSGAWLQKSVEKANVIGDTNVYHVYAGFFDFDVNPYPSYQEAIYTGKVDEILALVNNPSVQFGSYQHFRRYAFPDYLIMNDYYMTHKSLLFKKPISISPAIDGLSEVEKLYNNGQISIYKVVRER